MTITDTLARTQRANRCALAAALELAPRPARRAIVNKTAIATGGFVMPEAPSDRDGPMDASISLLGICGAGHDLDAAIAQWIKCVLRAERALLEEERAA